MFTKKIVLWALGIILAIAVISFFTKQYFQSQNYIKTSPKTGEITEAVYGLGKVKSNQRYDVKLGINSFIKNVYVKEGDSVKKGQSLLKADESTFRAPFDGTITLVSIYEGETATPQAVLIRLENLTDRFIELSLEQEAALRVQKGQHAKVSFESLRGKVLSGQVTAVYSRGSDFLTNVDVQDLDEKVLPGMSADVSIEIGKIQGMLIPVKALRNGVVRIERDGKTQNLKVEVGLVDGLSAEIKDDSLKPTDLILIPKER